MGGWTTFGGSCYKVITEIVTTYDEAKAKCTAEGAELVSIETKEEHDFLGGLMETAAKSKDYPKPTKKDHKGFDAWMSAKRPNIDTGYTWVTGEDVDFQAWKGGAPV